MHFLGTIINAKEANYSMIFTGVVFATVHHIETGFNSRSLRKVRAHGLEEGVVFARLIGSLKTIRARTLRMEVVHPFANQQ
jgi:hypothetical protein